MFQKFWCMESIYEEEGDITIFCWNFFFSQCRRISWEEVFNISEKFRQGKILCIGRGYQSFLLKLFFLTVPKIFVG